MRAHYLQHVPFEGLGSIEPWLRARGFSVTATRFFEDPALPDPRGIDLLVVMGGPMSVNDDASLPWLVDEKRFVRAAIDANIPVLGICLGAQLIASAMGARVQPGREKEIGWFPVQAVHAAHAPGLARPDDVAEVFRFPPTVEVFHWHGETFDLPTHAVRLARSEACEHQAFQLGRSVIGLQFHLETTPVSAREIVAHCRDELRPGPTVQDEATLLAADAERYRRINALMSEVLAFLTRARGPAQRPLGSPPWT